MRMFRMQTILATGLLVAAAGPLAAQATRTWVSGVGDDVNPCSRTAPCKTFAGAISKTAPFGEINVLDPGGFGGVTITKSITIDGSGGSIAGVLVAGTNGILVAAGASDTVILRNLDIDGTNVAGTVRGIEFLTGKQLIIDHCNVYGFGQRNIDIEPTTANTNTLISNTLVHDGLNNGIVVTPTAAASVVLDNVQSVNHPNLGLVVVNGNVQVRNSVISNNTAAGIDVHSTGVVEVVSSVLSNNGNGIQSSLSGSPIARLSNVSIFDNSLSGVNFTIGTIYTFSNNQMAGNGGPNFGTLVPLAQQ